MANPIHFAIYTNQGPIVSLDVKNDQIQLSSHLPAFIMYSALDIVDEKRNSTTAKYLGVIDKSNGYYVSAYLSSGNIHKMLLTFLFVFLNYVSVTFMLLHEKENYKEIGEFFNRVEELYIRGIMNPFVDSTCPFNSKAFNNMVKSYASKL